ncbi:hypothetical protein BO82DRAFT_285009 [Aspergillus uvarum CBS 121591]|uniref:Uncharacterized protein n=1 Tax=Aspergillus uvarum CBS 121591 TaxID=1448315 RepID=A0A319CA18_9EURO|nr:hypothetical protein BO82DRAFT_285009 [Aspergillus uvarum CBS 121591]PYH81060.1 hypothetical protein BO82DRAFT_285009 [Aspergillus uvarum CBS 121591]
MNFFDWIFTPFGRAPTPEQQEYVWNPETVTMQQPAATEAPSTKIPTMTQEPAALSLRGGGEAGEVCCGV